MFGAQTTECAMQNRYQLAAKVTAINALDARTIEAMWGVFSRYYDDVTRNAFDSDLRAKDHVILLIDRANGAVAGFSTVQSYKRVVAGRKVVVVYSGDTICDEKYWGQRALHSAFLKYIVGVKLRNPATPVYWFLISKGYKTYLLLAKNFVEFWPRYDKRTPAWQDLLIDTLARDKFGLDWRPELGVLRFTTPKGKLRGGVAPIGMAERRDPHIAFFAGHNPGADNGDELCCVGHIGPALAVKYFWRRVVRALSPLRQPRPLPTSAVVGERS
jgi:hypothetical protein